MFLHRNKWIYLTALLVNLPLTTPPAYAFDTQTINKWQPEHYVVTLGFGSAITSDVGSSQNYPIVNPSTDEFYYYSPNHATQTSGLYEAFLGGEWDVKPNWALQAGLDYNQASPFNARGTLTQGADVLSENTYSYHYSISSQQLLLAGKLLYTLKEAIHPYLMAGIGAAFNDAYNYYTSAPINLTYTRLYDNHTTTSFSYAIGLGVDYNLSPKFRAGLGYRFANLGQVKLGNAMINTTSVSGTLSQSHLYTNELLAQLTWVI